MTTIDFRQVGVRTARFALVVVALTDAACAPEYSPPVPDAAPVPWVTIDTSSERLVSIDSSRIEFGDAYRSAWIRLDFARDQVLPPTGRGPYRAMIMREELNCASRRVRHREIEARDSAETVLMRGEFPEGAWVPFDDPSMPGHFLDQVCVWTDRHHPRTTA